MHATDRMTSVFYAVFWGTWLTLIVGCKKPYWELFRHSTILIDTKRFKIPCKNHKAVLLKRNRRGIMCQSNLLENVKRLRLLFFLWHFPVETVLEHTLPTAVNGSLLNLHLKALEKRIFSHIFVSIFCTLMSPYVFKWPQKTTVTVIETERSVRNTESDIFLNESQIISPRFILIVPTKSSSWFDFCPSVRRARQSTRGIITARGPVVGQPALKRSAFLLWKRLVRRQLSNSLLVDAVKRCLLISITQREKYLTALGVCPSYDLPDKMICWVSAEFEY